MGGEGIGELRHTYSYCSTRGNLALQSFSHPGNDGKYMNLHLFRYHEHICAQGKLAAFSECVLHSVLILFQVILASVIFQLRCVLCQLANAANNISQRSDLGSMSFIICMQKFSHQ